MFRKVVLLPAKLASGEILGGGAGAHRHAQGFAIPDTFVGGADRRRPKFDRPAAVTPAENAARMRWRAGRPSGLEGARSVGIELAQAADAAADRDRCGLRKGDLGLEVVAETPRARATPWARARGSVRPSRGIFANQRLGMSGGVPMALEWTELPVASQFQPYCRKLARLFNPWERPRRRQPGREVSEKTKDTARSVRTLRLPTLD